MNGLQNADGISEANYMYWAAAYGASVDVPPMPTKYVTVALAEDVGDKGNDKYAARLKSDFVVEEGYMAVYAATAGKSAA